MLPLMPWFALLLMLQTVSGLVFCFSSGSGTASQKRRHHVPVTICICCALRNNVPPRRHRFHVRSHRCLAIVHHYRIPIGPMLIPSNAATLSRFFISDMPFLGTWFPVLASSIALGGFFQGLSGSIMFTYLSRSVRPAEQNLSIGPRSRLTGCPPC
jgi:hypothetical protein